MKFLQKVFSLLKKVIPVAREIREIVPVRSNDIPTVKLSNSSTSKKEKIQSILNVFETGLIKGDYANISEFNDGPNNIKQITYGRSQTTEFGNLKKLIELYIQKGGAFASQLTPFVGKIGKHPSLVTNAMFKDLLRKAGKQDPIMIAAQDEFFDEHYWKPAETFFKDNGFTLPLSMLVIYDSYIHSGSIPLFLRRRFDEVPPARGGDEKTWIKQYTEARQYWLANHSTRPILRKTVYRTKSFLQAMNANDWNLDQPFNANGVVVK